MSFFRIRMAVGIMAIAMAGPGLAQPTPARTNLSGPTVSQIHADRSLVLNSREVRPGPIQRVGPAPYWYNLGEGVAVAFSGCGDDARCDAALIFATLGILSEAQRTVAHETVPLCMTGGFGMRAGRAAFLGAGETGIFLPVPLDNRSPAMAVHSRVNGFHRCVREAREAIAAH